MKEGIGRAVLRGTVASVAGVAAMDLYFRLLKSVEGRVEAKRSDHGEGRRDTGEREQQQEPWRAEEGQHEAWRPEGSEQEAWRGSAESREQQSERWASQPGREPERGSHEPGHAEHVEGRSAWQEGDSGASGPSPGAQSGTGASEKGEGDGHGKARGPARRIWRRFAKNRVLDDISVIDPPPRKEGEPPTVAVGRIAYETLRGDEPSRETGKQLGKVVHWTYGLAMGGLYGLLDPAIQDREVTAGLGYGAALWLLGDELLVPMLGLAKGPTAHPPRVHVEAFGAHLVYGLVTATAHKALRSVM